MQYVVTKYRKVHEKSLHVSYNNRNVPMHHQGSVSFIKDGKYYSHIIGIGRKLSLVTIHPSTSYYNKKIFVLAWNSCGIIWTMKQTLSCIQVSRKEVVKFELRGRVRPAQKIAVMAKPDATPFLNYRIPIIGADVDDFSLLIECNLPDPTSRLPQEMYYTINSSFQCL